MTTNENMSCVIDVQIRDKIFIQGGASLLVLENFHFVLKHGHFLTLYGPSGCGKTTALRIIAGLDSDYSGSVRIFGHLVQGPGVACGIVFQESRLLPWKTVEKNVEYALESRIPRNEKQHMVDCALDLVEIRKAKILFPNQLSGGMQKRVALARALVNVPRVLLLDEPFSALDSQSRLGLYEQIIEIRKKHHVSIIMVTHDLDEAICLSDEIAILSSSPSKVVDIVPVELPYPRRQLSEQFESIRFEILKNIKM